MEVYHTSGRPVIPSFQRPWSARDKNDAPYILLTSKAIDAYASDPLALGIYIGVTRLCVAAKGPIPLSRSDIIEWSGRGVSIGAVSRALAKLMTAGWLSATQERKAGKYYLAPTWGRNSATNQPIPWQFDRSDGGRPSHLRESRGGYQRVPVALLDIYIGILEPQATNANARPRVRRYFTRPLLSLADAGEYVISRRFERLAAPRLAHVGLIVDGRVSPPADLLSLLLAATTGALTTLDEHGRAVPVHPSSSGEATLATKGVRPIEQHVFFEHMSGSHGRSEGRSVPIPDNTPINIASESDISHVSATIAPHPWRDGNQELTNIESPMSYVMHDGGGDSHEQSLAASIYETLPSTEYPGVSALDPLLIAGHQQLNSERAIPVGEWLELLELQQAHGAIPLLVWQARAARAATREHGIRPGYYQACAAREAVDTYQVERGRPTDVSSVAAAIPASGHPAAAGQCHENVPAVAPESGEDAERHQLLSEIGVRERRKLVQVPVGLLRRWASVIAHEGLTATFASPVGFAISQMIQGNAPPPLAELERWAARARACDAAEKDGNWIYDAVGAPSATGAAPAASRRLYLSLHVGATIPASYPEAPKEVRDDPASRRADAIACECDRGAGAGAWPAGEHGPSDASAFAGEGMARISRGSLRLRLPGVQ